MVVEDTVVVVDVTVDVVGTEVVAATPVVVMVDTQAADMAAATPVVDTTTPVTARLQQLHNPKTTTPISRVRSESVLPSPALILLLSLNLVRPIREVDLDMENNN